MTSTTPLDTTPPPSLRRRRAAAVCLALAPVAMLVEMASWPVGSDGSTAQELQSAAASPTAYTIAWLAESIGAVLAVVGVVGLLGYLRGRGRTLALIGTILVGLGQSVILTGGGFNAAVVPLAQLPERDVAVRALDAFNAQPLLHVLVVLIWLGLVGTVLTFVAAVRGGLIRWWVLVLVAVALVTVPVLDNDLYGLAAAATGLPLAAAEIWLAVALFRTRRASSPLVAPTRTAAEPSGVEPVSA